MWFHIPCPPKWVFFAYAYLASLLTSWSPPSDSFYNTDSLRDHYDFIIGHHRKTNNQTCTLEEFNGCMRQLNSITESEELSLASSRMELEILCGKWKQGYRCMDQHMLRCSDRHKQIIYNDVVQGTRQVMNELCSPGRMQNDYLRHAPCFKSLFVDGGRCSQKYKSMIQMSKVSANLSEDADIEEGLRRTCCTFNEYVHCYHVHMPELCGEEGRKFFTTYSDKMSGPLIHQHCASYTYDSTCNRDTSGAVFSLPQRQHLETYIRSVFFELFSLAAASYWMLP